MKISIYISGAIVSLHLGLSLLFITKIIPSNINDALNAFESLAATAVLFLAAWYSRGFSRSAILTWLMLALGQASNTIGSVIFVFFTSRLGAAPDLSPADPFFLFSYLFFLGSIIFMPARADTKREKVKFSLDVIAIFLAISMIYDNFIFIPLYRSVASWPLLDQAITLAYPLADLGVIIGFLFLIRRIPFRSMQVPYMFIISCLLVNVTTDSFSYSPGSLQSAAGILSFGYALCYVLIGLAGVSQILTMKRLKAETLEMEYVAIQAWWSGYLPYFALLISYFVMVWSHYYPIPVPHLVLIIWFGLTLATVVVRQLLSIWENHKLDDDLYGALNRLKLQADSLMEVNQKLEGEISQRQRAEEKLVYETLHDGLTGLPNRSFFSSQLDRSIEQARRYKDYAFSVFMLDLDGFKLINDSLGHANGDLILTEIARRFQQVLRASDMVARFSGDQFIFMIDNIAGTELVIIANRIMESLRAPFTLEGRNYFITASMGIVEYEDYTTPSDILRDADIALYHAKLGGKNRYLYFKTSMRSTAYDRMELERDLRKAIEDEEFILHYQPIVSLRQGGLVVGFEALIRWDHPVRGLVMPGEFIPLAEETGLIVPIGTWVLEHACRQMREWQTTIPGIQSLYVSVNVSGKQLIDDDIVAKVIDALEHTGLEGKCLYLEITESSLVSSGDVVPLLHRLKNIGVKMMVDDFGTGYSSLSYLQRFPVQMLKIDRSFVTNIQSNVKNRKIVKSILRLAEDINMAVLAEGIETFEEFSEVRRAGCFYGQGYMFSRPVDALIAGTLIGQRLERTLDSIHEVVDKLRPVQPPAT